MAVHVPGCWLALPASAARHTHKSQLLTHLSTLGRRHHTPRRVPRWGLRGRGRPRYKSSHTAVWGVGDAAIPIGVCHVFARGRGANPLHLLHPSSTAEPCGDQELPLRLLGVVLWHMGGHVSCTAWGESPRQPPTYVGRARLIRVCSAHATMVYDCPYIAPPCACGAP